MSKNDQHSGPPPERYDGGFEAHVDEADLILYLDHELGSDDSARISSHLAFCADCRQLHEELAQTSEAFALVQSQFDDALPVPPGNWTGFEQRLAAAIDERAPVPEPRLNLLGISRRKSDFRRALLPWGLATAATLLLVSYLWLHSPTNAPTLTVHEIVDQVVQKQVSSTSIHNAVIYRKLRVSISTAPDSPVVVQQWKRVSDGRVREVEGDLGEPRPHRASARQPHGRPSVQPDSPESGTGLLDQLHKIYSATHLDWSEPISVANFKAWADSEAPVDEQVIPENLPLGGHAYRLIARAKNPLSSPKRDWMSELQVVVRSSDWHAVEESLTVQGSSGVRTYEVAELEYRELPTSEAPASLFESPAARTALASDVPKPALGMQPASGPALTLEVLRRLDAVDALVKDQIEVSRVGTEGLTVQGTASSDSRKAEILAALGPLASNPALKLDVASPSEVRDKAAREVRAPSPLQSIQVPLEKQIPNPRLRDWLAGHRGVSGSQLEIEAQRFAMDAIALSTDAQLQAQALARVLAVMPTPPLDQEAAESWRGIVTRHAGNVQKKVQALQQQLLPVFGASARPLQGSKSHDHQDFLEETHRLLELATATDQALWQAFSAPSSDSTQGQLTDPKFWLMLEEEDSLAAHLMQEARP